MGLPRPSKVSEAIQDDENTFIFCSAMITQDVLMLSNGHSDKYILKEVFKNAIQKFGEYALVFYSAEIIDRLNTVMPKHVPKFGYKAGNIIYRDLNDFSERGDYYTSYSMSNSVYDRYFLKDINYKNQNEWRLVIDGSEKHLNPNNGEGFSIFIGKLDYVYLIDTPTFLNTFQYVDND